MMRSWIAASFFGFVSLVNAAEPNAAGVDPVESARREFQNGKLEPALAILDEAEKRAPLTGRGLDTRGCILTEQGKFEEAIKAFEAAHENETWIYARLHMGDALVRQKKWEEARNVYASGAKETSVLVVHERYRFGTFMTYLGAKDEEAARRACDSLPFPSESAAYYYAQAAWSFAHGKNREGDNWIKRATDVFPAKGTTWFARHLYDFGWLKSKPPISLD